MFMKSGSGAPGMSGTPGHANGGGTLHGGGGGSSYSFRCTCRMNGTDVAALPNNHMHSLLLKPNTPRLNQHSSDFEPPSRESGLAHTNHGPTNRSIPEIGNPCGYDIENSQATMSGNWLPQYLLSPRIMTQSSMQSVPETLCPSAFPPAGSCAGGPPEMIKSVVIVGFVLHDFH